MLWTILIVILKLLLIGLYRHGPIQLVGAIIPAAASASF